MPRLDRFEFHDPAFVICVASIVPAASESGKLADFQARKARDHSQAQGGHARMASAETSRNSFSLAPLAA